MTILFVLVCRTGGRPDTISFLTAYLVGILCPWISWGPSLHELASSPANKWAEQKSSQQHSQEFGESRELSSSRRLRDQQSCLTFSESFQVTRYLLWDVPVASQHGRLSFWLLTGKYSHQHRDMYRHVYTYRSVIKLFMQ